MKNLQNNYVAAIDMGTNSFHLIIAKIKENGTFKIVDREKEICRLGSHKGENLSLISKEEKKLAIQILKRFKDLAEKYEAPIRAVATSAVRESLNKEEFIEEVLKETGIEIEVIDGIKEAKLIYKGVRKSNNFSNQKILCVDIGGGSTEILLGKGKEIIFAGSVKVGAVRLSKMFFPDYVINSENIKPCDNYIKNEFNKNKHLNFSSSFDLSVGTSGTIQAIAAIIKGKNNKAKEKSLKGFIFNKDEFRAAYDKILAASTINERFEIKGMESKRADIIPAGAIILNNVFEFFNINEMIISDFALREGIIFDSIKKNNFEISA